MKRMALIARHSALDRTAFSQHWLGPHAALVRQMSNVVAYDQNHVQEVLWQQPGCEPFSVDGIPELSFGAGETQPTHGVSEQLLEDELRFMSGLSVSVVQTQGRRGPAGVPKAILVGARPQGRSIEAFQAGVAALVARLGQKALAVETNWTDGAFGRPHLPCEEPAPAVYVNAWFADVAALQAAFAVDGEVTSLADNALDRGMVLQVDEVTIVADVAR